MNALSLLPLASPVVVAWAMWQRRRILRHGRHLTAQQLRVAAAVGVREPKRVRVLLVERVPLPGGHALDRVAQRLGLPGPDVDGLTLGHGIFIRGNNVPTGLLAHECRHVQQVEAAGTLRRFLVAYLRQVAQHGYHDAPYEVDARHAAAAFCAGRASA
jgi:hypothetical protein